MLHHLKPGQTVFHRHFGQGIIIKPWGSWHFCRDCLSDALLPTHADCPYCNAIQKTRYIKDPFNYHFHWSCSVCNGETNHPHHAYCPHCGTVTLLIRVNAHDTFYVQFQHQVIPINQCWLSTNPNHIPHPKPLRQIRVIKLKLRALTHDPSLPALPST